MTGKGGTGKTTVAAALGLVAARAGKRVVVCEVSRQHRLPDAFGVSGEGELELAPDLWTVSIDPDVAVEEYLRVQMGSRRLAGLLAHNRLFEVLAQTTPGLRELVTVGKAWDLAQPRRRSSEGQNYDLVLVDAPATGHGVALLRAPRTFRDATRVGPVARQAGTIHSFLTTRGKTGVVAVALAEEMPVNETMELAENLRGEMGMTLDGIVVNAVYPERFTGPEAERIEAAVSNGANGDAAAALRAAIAEHRWARGQRSELRRLRDRSGSLPGKPDVATLPFLFEPELGPDEIERLSRDLERRL